MAIKLNTNYNLQASPDFYLTCTPSDDGGTATLSLEKLAKSFDPTAPNQRWQLQSQTKQISNCQIVCILNGTTWYLQGDTNGLGYFTLSDTINTNCFNIIDDGKDASSLTLMTSDSSSVFGVQGSGDDATKVLQSQASSPWSFLVAAVALVPGEEYYFQADDGAGSYLTAPGGDASPQNLTLTSRIDLNGLSVWKIDGTLDAPAGLISDAQIHTNETSAPDTKWYLSGMTVADPVQVFDTAQSVRWQITDNGDGTAFFQSEKEHGSHGDNIGYMETSGTEVITEAAKQPTGNKQKFKFTKVALTQSGVELPYH
jgi:hypothetical protein